jgi:GNAT superfamily N-acetyltransferase
MRIERWDPADLDAARACFEVRRAVRAADDPMGSPRSERAFFRWLTGGVNAEPTEVWLAGGEAEGTVIGYCRLVFPDLENKERVWVDPFTHPAHRRSGIGRALLRHAARQAAARGRVALDSGALQDSPGDAFARRAGATPTILEPRRVLDPRRVPPGQVASIRASAARAAGGYSLVSWTGPVPDKHLAGVASVHNAFNDAPHGEDFEPEEWDARRVRERLDDRLRSGVRRGYSVAALHDAAGDMAALTRLEVDQESPEWGLQGMTAVARPHRGHRLGLLVKAAMLELLAAAEPKLERIETGNASSNRHMIAINETLGFELSGSGQQFFELSVADALR